MNIIPGAFYLSPSENRVYIGRGDGSLGYLRKPHYLVMFCYSSDMFPTDLILLYAPGDEVLQLEREWIHPTRMLRREGVVTEIYRSTDV